MVLKISIVTAVIVAIFTAFLVVRTTDEVTPSGTTMVVTIWDTGSQISRGETRQLVVDRARDRDLTLYKSVDTIGPSTTTRTLYVLTTGADATLPDARSNYPDFGRSIQTRFADGDRLPLSEVTGMYVTGAPESVADDFARDLIASGMTVTTRRADALSLVMWTSNVVPLIPLVTVALLGLALGCAHTVVSFRRQDAIAWANGASRRWLIAVHLAKTAAFVVACGAAGSAVAAPLLAAYNGLAQFARFASGALVGTGVVLIATCVIAAAVILLESRVPAVTAVAGKRPVRRLAGFTLLCHAGSLGLVLLIGSAVIGALADPRVNRTDSTAWNEASSLFALTFHTTPAEFDELIPKFGELAHSAMAEGHVLVAATVPERDGYGPDDGKAVIVNSRYLDEQRVADIAGRRIQAGDLDPARLTLLIPEGAASHRASIERVYEEWSAFQRSSEPQQSERDVPVQVVVTAPGQDVFTYSTDEATSRRLDPVIVVLPRDERVVSNDWLASTMTTGGVLFDDRSVLHEALRSAGLDDYVGSIDRASDRAAIRLSDQEKAARASTAAGALAAIVAMLSSVLVGVAVAESNRRSDLIRSVHGAGRLGIARSPLIVFTSSVVVALGIVIIGGSIPTPPAAFAMVAALGADLIIAGVALGVARRCFRRDTLRRF